MKLDQGNLDGGPGQRRLHADPLAHRRPRRAAQHRSRQRRGGQRYERPVRHHPAAADHRDFHPRRGRDRRGVRADERRQADAGDWPSIARRERTIATGTLLTVDNQVNTTTGTVRARATFPNSHNELFPSQFVNARLLVKTLTQVNLVPQAAIQRNNDVAFVYVVQVRQHRSVPQRQDPGDRGGDRPPSPASIRGDAARHRRLRQAAERHQGVAQSGADAGPPVTAGGRRSSEAARMNPSRPFILRPIATSLLMAAILLVGIIGFPAIARSRRCPRSTTRRCRCSPSIRARAPTWWRPPSPRRWSGSSARCRASTRCCPPAPTGASVITLQFNLSLNIDVAEQDVQEAINAAQNYLPSQLPMPPVYNKVNPADAPILTLALTSDSMPLSAGRGLHRHAPCGKNLAAARGRRGHDQRRPKARGPGPGQPDAARLLRPQSRGCAHRARADQPGHRQGQLRRAGAELSDRRQRSNHHGRGFQEDGPRLPQRRAGHARRT